MRATGMKAFDFDELRAHNNEMRLVSSSTAAGTVSREPGIVLYLVLLLGKVAESIRTGAANDMDSTIVYGKLLADMIIRIDQLAKYAGLDTGELVRCLASVRPIGTEKPGLDRAAPEDRPLYGESILMPMMRLKLEKDKLQAELNLHREALTHAHQTLMTFAELTDRTFAKDESGNRTGDGEPDCSAADLFEELSSMDSVAAEALETVAGVLFTTNESPTT